MKNYHTIIVGAGLSGLTVAHKIAHNIPEGSLKIFDGMSRAGGCLESFQEQGYIAEIGPHGFLDNCQESRDLLAETGLDQESVKAPLIDFVRYVYLHGKLNLIEQTPLKIIKAPLIPWPDKFKVLQDLWKKPLEGEPTVAKWVNHRFGAALLPYVDAVFTGTYAGDYNRLKIDAVMPGVRQLEKQHGSVIRGIVHKMLAGRKTGKKKGITMPAMTSFPGGMQRLTEKLAQPFLDDGSLCLETSITAVSRAEDSWHVTTNKGEQFSCNHLVLAVPVNTSLQLLQQVDDTMPLATIPQTKIATVVFGYDNGSTLPPGFGFLIPEVEDKFILGTLFSSNMFPGRAPEGHIVFETLIGGRRHPERLDLDDDQLVERAKKEVKEILNLSGEPCYTRVLRSWSGIPQLEEKFPDLLQWKNKIVAETPGLHICGFGWGGIGINDMIKGGTAVAKEVIEGQREQGETEIKKVYF